jgi:hypothetical protein
MAEHEQTVNAGEQVSNTPSGIGLSPEAQFRNLNARIEALTDQVSRLATPPTFRIADMVQLGIIVIGLIIAMFTALGLSSRIDDVGKTQTAAESRVTAAVTATETRITTRLDKLNDRVTAIGERTANIEGQKAR